jgi:DNA-binding IscR family transcriptional regulator
MRVIEDKPKGGMAMQDPITEFLQARCIDSFQKLIFLLFLYQHPDLEGTSQEFGTQMYLGSTKLMEKILDDLQKAGLVDKIETGYKLHNETDIDPNLRQLARAFEDPLTRQQIIDQVRHH